MIIFKKLFYVFNIYVTKEKCRIFKMGFVAISHLYIRVILVEFPNLLQTFSKGFA